MPAITVYVPDRLMQALELEASARATTKSKLLVALAEEALTPKRDANAVRQGCLFALLHAPEPLTTSEIASRLSLDASFVITALNDLLAGAYVDRGVRKGDESAPGLHRTWLLSDEGREEITIVSSAPDFVTKLETALKAVSA